MPWLNGVCKHGRINGSVESFKEMHEKGLKGNSISCTALISAFCNVNNIEKGNGIVIWNIGS